MTNKKTAAIIKNKLLNIYIWISSLSSIILMLIIGSSLIISSRNDTIKSLKSEIQTISNSIYLLKGELVLANILVKRITKEREHYRKLMIFFKEKAIGQEADIKPEERLEIIKTQADILKNHIK